MNKARSIIESRPRLAAEHLTSGKSPTERAVGAAPAHLAADAVAANTRGERAAGVIQSKLERGLEMRAPRRVKGTSAAPRLAATLAKYDPRLATPEQTLSTFLDLVRTTNADFRRPEVKELFAPENPRSVGGELLLPLDFVVATTNVVYGNTLEMLGKVQVKNGVHTYRYGGTAYSNGGASEGRVGFVQTPAGWKISFGVGQP
jgi:hypothetical protein